MSIWKWVGAVGGGVGGFLVGGPAGAVAGATIGYGAGAEADASNESADAVDKANAAAAGVTAPKLNTDAYGKQPGFWGGPQYVSPETQQQIEQMRILDEVIASTQKELQDMLAQGIGPGNPQYDQRLQYLNNNMRIRPGAQKDLAEMQAKDAVDPKNSDSARFANAAIGANATPGVKVDWSGAQQAQADQAASRASEGQFIGAQDAAGMGQTDLAGRLRSDLDDNSHSQAQLQLAAATQQAINQQASTVASASPTNYALASRTAQMQNAVIGANAANASAQLRASEYQNTVGQLEKTLADQRQTNIQAAIQQRVQDLQNQGMSYQNAIQQAQIEVDQRHLNAQRENQFLGAYQSAQQFGQGAQMRGTEKAADVNLQTQGIKAGLTGKAIDAQMADAAGQRQMGASMIGAGGGMISSGISSGAFRNGGGTPPATDRATSAGLVTKNPYEV